MQTTAGVGVGVGLAHPKAHAQPRSTVRFVQNPCTMLPSSHCPKQGRLSQASPHPPKVGVGGGVELVTHSQLPETTWHVPAKHGALGQMVPGVHGGQTAHPPLHGKPTQEPIGGRVGVGAATIAVTSMHPPPSMQMLMHGCDAPVTQTASPT